LSVPSNTAFVVHNNKSNAQRIIREHGKEIIGTIDFVNTVPTNGRYTVNEFDVDPLYLEGTRLNQIAKSFQKFRMKNGTKFTIQTQAPTTTTGGYVAGYTENPDQDMGTGKIATSAISALSGSVSAPAWATQEIPIHVRDTKWYNLDDDTIEIMDAIQGKLVVQQTSALNTTAVLSAPVWLEWDCEFCGPAVQVDSNTPTAVIFPYGQIQASPAADTSAFHTAQVGCQILNGSGAVDTTATDTLYELIPGFETETGESVNFTWVYLAGSSKYFLFAGTKDEALAGKYMNWMTLFNSTTGNLSNDGAVAYTVRNYPPPLPGRSAEQNDIEPLLLNFNRSLRLNAQQLSRESALERQNRLTKEQEARSLVKLAVSKRKFYFQ